VTDETDEAEQASLFSPGDEDNASLRLERLEEKIDYIAKQVHWIATKIAEFEANISPALAAVSNGGILSMLTGRSKK
jgi:transcription termination factor NusB